jgi:hypothetical protein
MCLMRGHKTLASHLIEVCVSLCRAYEKQKLRPLLLIKKTLPESRIEAPSKPPIHRIFCLALQRTIFPMHAIISFESAQKPPFNNLNEDQRQRTFYLIGAGLLPAALAAAASAANLLSLYFLPLMIFCKRFLSRGSVILVQSKSSPSTA